MTTSTPEKQDGLKALQVAIEEVEATITKLGGVFKVQMPVSIEIAAILLYPYACIGRLSHDKGKLSVNVITRFFF